MAFGAALVDLGQPQEAIEHFEFVLAHCAAPTPDPQIVHHCIWSRYQRGRSPAFSSAMILSSCRWG